MTQDARAWLVPCVFVRAGCRGSGVSHSLLRAAVALARGAGALSVEGCPLAASASRPADRFLGREQVFADLGFACVDQPAPDRVTMWLELGGT